MSKYNPKVSVLIPCYNGSKYIDRCLNTCMEQTYKNLDILVIDDGSIDDSLEKLNGWKKIDSRIRVISQPNCGLAETRNILVNNTECEYFTFLDIDDTMPKDAIEKLVKNSEEGKNDVVVGRTYVIYESNHFRMPFFPAWRYVSNMTKGHYIKSNICTPWCSLIKTKYFKSLGVKFLPGRIFEDIGVMTFVFMNSKNFKSIKDVIYQYHRIKVAKGSTATLSSFWSVCFKKTNDLVNQLDNVLSYLYEHNLVNDKENRRYVNGLLFQAIPATIFLTNSLTKNKYYRYVIRHDLVSVAKKYGLFLRFSKTFWKSLTFFFIWISGHKSMRDCKKGIMKKQFIRGSASIEIKSKNRIVRGYGNDEKPKATKFFLFNIKELSNTKFYHYKNTNIILDTKKWTPDIFEKTNKIVNVNNLLPFALIRSNTFEPKLFDKYQESFFGIKNNICILVMIKLFV